MPFTTQWTDGTPEQRGRGTVQHLLGTIARWRPDDWKLGLAVRLRDADAGNPVVGRQDLMATDFAVTREARTGSWLGLAHQGRGIGTEMRAAVVHLAFAGLGARAVRSEAMTDNARSNGVSRKLGYVRDGTMTAPVRGQARTLHRLLLDRETWEASERHRTTPVELHGLEECRALFGLP
jgi:RimJ/RimL family protein N-acetyltransferase